MGNLRRTKRRVALLTALADITGLWTLERMTEVLRRFADLATQQAVDLVLREAAQAANRDREQTAAGRIRHLVVLGMGKLGAFELNYSSDIDLIVLFEPTGCATAAAESPMAFAVRLDPRAGACAGAPHARWLRVPHRSAPAAAPAGASACAVDRGRRAILRTAWPELGARGPDQGAGGRRRSLGGRRLPARTRAFLWRRHLDYAAIRDIHSIKRQINAYRGHGQIRVAGHDLKVGRGGIREIEFFVQTQQLILGGRLPELRAPGTCAALRALVDARWLESAIADELIEAYRFLRSRRAPPADDRRQTDPQPAEPAPNSSSASRRSWVIPMRRAWPMPCATQLERVEAHYAALFETSIDLGGGRRAGVHRHR